MPHLTAHDVLALDKRHTVDPLHLPTLDGHSLEWPQTWNTAVRMPCMAPRGPRLTGMGAKDISTESRATAVSQAVCNNTDFGVRTRMSVVCTLL